MPRSKWNCLKCRNGAFNGFLAGFGGTLLLWHSIGEFQGDFADAAEVQLAGAQVRQLFDGEELIGARDPKIRQAGPRKSV